MFKYELKVKLDYETTMEFISRMKHSGITILTNGDTCLLLSNSSDELYLASQILYDLI